MHADQRPYRELYAAILEYDGADLAEDVVLPWARTHEAERRWFAALAATRITAVRPMPVADLWRLYAMSRICDLLRLGCARRPGYETTWTIAVPPAAYDEFMAAFAFQPIAEPRFHPFFHEIVLVEQAADDDAPPAVLAELWPGHTLGPLLFVRAGVRVAAGRRHLLKEVAEGSTLYWAYARATRPARDPSHGWGSNSQWRTGFRRDYAIGGELHYNVDATPGPPDEADDLAPAEWLELVRHRCFVRCDKPHDDRWPYDRSHRERRS